MLFSNESEALSQESSSESEIEEMLGAHPSRSLQPHLSKSDIHRNIILLVLMDTAWLFGATEMGLASSPLYVYLKASNTLIGLINGTFILGLFGIFISPFITIKFPVKKLYVLVVHIPYLLPWGLIGSLLFSRAIGG